MLPAYNTHTKLSNESHLSIKGLTTHNVYNPWSAKKDQNPKNSANDTHISPCIKYH